jgi:TonB-dependent receptor-like protein
MGPLDVVRTAGSAADLMRALQVLPGVVQADEGAGLYVRGGDTSEVLVLLDDAVVFHPYRSETPGGGLFGSVDPFLLEGVSFATGGFSAKYGNALSAVLDMHGLKRPDVQQTSVTLGLAGASVRGATPIGEHGGVRFSGNRAFPGLLFAVNGRPYDFDPLPGGWNADASAHYTSPGAGAFKFFVNGSGDGVGVRIDSLNFDGLLQSSVSTVSSSMQWQKVVRGAWLTTAAAGVTRYARGQRAGVLDLATADARGSWRVTTERAWGAWTLRTGVDGVDARTQTSGAVPNRGGDLGGAAGSQAIDARYDDDTVGTYGEVEHRAGRVTAIAGGRAQYFARAAESAFDPRLDVVIDTVPGQKISLAFGLYHQAPEAGYYAFAGPGGLSAMRARHLIAGYEVGGEDDAVHLRAEGYWKTYDGLPLEQTPGAFASSGYGNAGGVDLFAHVRRAPLDLMADYSYLDANRRWTPLLDRGKYTVLPAGMWHPDFDLPHTAHVLARLDMTRRLSASAGWRMASGKLDTPVVGAVATPAGYLPRFGAINSERLPAYARTDLTISYLSRLPGARSTVLFASVGNLFARTNVFEYAYSDDYSVRRPVTSATPRVFYCGITLTR